MKTNWNEVNTKIDSMATRAAQLIKARKMNLPEPQMNVFRKIVNNEMTGAWEWSSVRALQRKQLIAENPGRGNLDCLYIAII